MKKRIIVLLCCLVVTFGSLFIANDIQTDHGNIDVKMDSFEMEYVDPNGETKKGNVTYKLYVPKGVDANNKAPALLLLHGYQNDHETDAAFAIEMARRGVVVLAIDEFGHGSTDISMVNRGYVNHKVTVNYGLDSQEDGTFVEIGGQTRYKVLMNFSNLSFFLDKYSKDEDGNKLIDSSMGGICAYKLLSEMDIVDNTRMAVSGHSMGTWASWTTSAAYSNTPIMPKATILQAGELFSKDAYDSNNIKFNNVLLLTAKYDEFNYFRDYSKKTVDDDVISNDITSEFLDVDKGTGKWNTTYGSFNDGSARRRELVVTNHRLLTHNSNAISTSIDWLKGSIGLSTNLDNNDQIFMKKEVLTLLATFSSIVTMLVVMNILLDTKFFVYLKQPELNILRKSRVGFAYWKGAIITILIAFVTYPFMTQLGHGLLPLPDTSIFRMTIGNGFLSWYLILIIIMLLTTIIPYLKNKKKGNSVSFVDLGLSTYEKKDKLDFTLLFKGLLLAFIMASVMYVECLLAEKLFMLDFRFIWPFFKSFSLTRLGQFFVYIIIFLVFFLLNNSKIFAQNQPEGTVEKGIKGFLKCWYKNALCMIGGVLLLIVLEYTPFFMGFGPGADLLFSSTFGGPFMSLMIVFVPQVLVFSLICTYTYRKTGSVYVGAFLVAILACWIVTGGSALL
ncbi:MAG: hypothetical protein KBT35_07530 [Firmicutes bacterium]|nr:hypothetical protein [Candidatus Colivicinus equi]